MKRGGNGSKQDFDGVKYGKEGGGAASSFPRGVCDVYHRYHHGNCSFEAKELIP